MDNLQNLLADIRALLLQVEKPEALRLVTRIDKVCSCSTAKTAGPKPKPEKKKKD